MKRIIFALLVLILCAQCSPETDIINLPTDTELTYDVTEEIVDDVAVDPRNNQNSATATINLGLRTINSNIADQIVAIKIDTKTTNCVDDFIWITLISDDDIGVLGPMFAGCNPPPCRSEVIGIDDVETGGCDTEKAALGYNFRSILDIIDIRLILENGQVVHVNLRNTRFIAH